MYRLRDILNQGTLREVRPGVWVEARPQPPSFVVRLHDAWAVLTGKADALTWPDSEDESSWCAVDRNVRVVTALIGDGS